MKWGWRIVLGFLAAVAVDQTLRTLSKWQFEGNKAFFEKVVAEADLETFIQDVRNGNGWIGRVGCKFHRSSVGYRVQTCFAFRGNDLVNSIYPKDDPRGMLFILLFNEPRSMISLVGASYHFDLPGKEILSVDGRKKQIQWSVK